MRLNLLGYKKVCVDLFCACVNERERERAGTPSWFDHSCKHFTVTRCVASCIVLAHLGLFSALLAPQRLAFLALALCPPAGHQVRLPLLPVDFLTGTVAKEEMIKGNLSCRDLLDEARNYHLHLSNKVVPDFEYSVRTTPRKHTAGGPPAAVGVRPSLSIAVTVCDAFKESSFTSWSILVK